MSEVSNPPTGVPVQQMVGVIGDMLDNPYPWDLMQVRYLVRKAYRGDEEAAKAEMTRYCTEQFCADAVDRYLKSRRAALEVIRAYCPNDPSSATRRRGALSATKSMEQNQASNAEQSPGSLERMVRRALSDVISCALKRDDAPASSETHEHAAIVTLLELCPGWQPWDDESRQLVEDAKEHMAHYRTPPNEKAER